VQFAETRGQVSKHYGGLFILQAVTV